MLKCIRDSKPQGCVQQHKLLKVIRNATNRDKHINKASKQTFANFLFKILCKYTKVCFPTGRFVSMPSIEEIMTNICVNLAKIMKLQCKRPVPTSQFHVSKLQKQLQSVIQIRLDQSANFGPLPLNVCVTVSHNVVFNICIHSLT